MSISFFLVLEDLRFFKSRDGGLAAAAASNEYRVKCRRAFYFARRDEV